MRSDITYSDSGVDIDKADEAVQRLIPHAKSTFRKEVLSEVGGFGSIVALPDGYQVQRRQRYRDSQCVCPDSIDVSTNI